MTDTQIQAKITELSQAIARISHPGVLPNGKKLAELKRKDLQDQLAREFGYRHSWTLSPAWIHPGQLGRRSNRRALDERLSPCYDPSLLDHTYYYRSATGPHRRMPAAIAGHLYRPPDPDKLATFCMRHKLLCTIGNEVPFPSWWYPGETTLVLFQPLKP